MDYSQAEEYLNNFVNYEQIPGIPYVSAESSLKHVVKFLHGLGDPHLAASKWNGQTVYGGSWERARERLDTLPLSLSNYQGGA